MSREGGMPLVTAPFGHGGGSVSRTMLLATMALAPAAGYGLYLFGWPAINLFVVTVLSALVTEILCLALARKPIMPFLTDGSAFLTGWLVAMCLPPWAPWWIGLLGGVVAIGLGKQVFGGIGQNPFNPAMVARVALLVSFPVQMTFYVAPLPLGSAAAPGFLEGLAITFGSAADYDALSSASVLGHVKTELGRGRELETILAGLPGLWEMGLGRQGGSLGETSAWLLLAGGVALWALRVITWHIPVSLLATLAALAAVTHLLDPGRYPGAAFHLLSGATMLVAFFVATDLVTSPVTRRGQILFGIGCGLLIFVIRTWSAYPEGGGFAILLMNGATPLIDRWVRPRIFGRTASGKPLDQGRHRHD